LRDSNGYVLTEIWKAKPAWLGMPADERVGYFEERIGPLLGSVLSGGAELLACAVNDNRGPEAMDYRYMAVWRFPDRASSERLESAAREAGFLDYFEQINFSGSLISPDQLNTDMIKLR
jgi:hypothetical protein